MDYQPEQDNQGYPPPSAPQDPNLSTQPLAQPPQPPYGAPPPAYGAPQAPMPQPATPPPPQGGKKGKGGMVLAIVLAVLLAVSGGLNIWQFSSSSKTQAALTQQRDKAQSALDSMQEELDTASQELDEANATARQAEDAKARLTEQVEAMEQEIGDLEAELAKGGSSSGSNSSMGMLNLMDMMDEDDILTAVYHTEDCSKLDKTLYVGLPPSVISILGISPCPDCH